MSQELICITCPLGCHLSIDRNTDGSLAVSGNRCTRGVRYANEELLSPKRMVTATARVRRAVGTDSLGTVARLPVRSSAAFPKEGVDELLKAIYQLEVAVPVRRGTVLIADFQGSGIDIVAARSLAD
jgi:CxxC motif-containing protein